MACVCVNVFEVALKLLIFFYRSFIIVQLFCISFMPCVIRVHVILYCIYIVHILMTMHCMLMVHVPCVMFAWLHVFIHVDALCVNSMCDFRDVLLAQCLYEERLKKFVA